jgi:erythrocyte band 7 integral membrane protein
MNFNIGIYETFGRYVKTMDSGLQYFNSFTDKIHAVDMKTNIINLNRMKSLRRDNIEVDIDAAVYYNIKVPRRTFYCVMDIHKSVQELTFATLRSICGHYVLQELLEKRD